MSGITPKTYGERLVKMLRKLNQGERLDPKALANEFGVTLRAIQRDLNDRFGFLELEKRNGLYALPSHLLGKINLRDVERFASLAGVKGLFPSLNEDYLRELLTTRMQAAWLVKGAVYEELDNKGLIFEQLEEAILNHNPISYTYQKTEGIKSYNDVLPYKLVNFDGIWYLAGVDAGKLKAFTLVKLDRLQIKTSVTFTAEASIHQTLSDEDSIWLNAQKQEVVLKISGHAATYFRRRKLVAEQKLVKELEDGGLIISTKVAHTNQILPTVRQWIPHIHIISPDGLQATLEKDLRVYLEPR